LKVNIILLRNHQQVLLASDTSGIREMVPLADEFDASLLEASEQLEDAA